MPVARTETKVNAKYGLAATTGSKNEVCRLYVSMDKVPGNNGTIGKFVSRSGCEIYPHTHSE